MPFVRVTSGLTNVCKTYFRLFVCCTTFPEFNFTRLLETRKLIVQTGSYFCNPPAGERVSAYAPLGYKKHPDVKNKLVIDEKTSWIIRRIYTLAFYGAGAAKITRTLTQEKIPTPGWLNYQRDGTFANIYRDAPEEKRYAWTIAQVKSILKDETYIGNTIHYRETNISYKKRIRKPQSEWMRVEGTQEAIISKEDFERVQQ